MKRLLLVALLAGCQASSLPSELVCDDGLDDDANGLADCADPACTGHPSCASGPDVCTDAVVHDLSCG